MFTSGSTVNGLFEILTEDEIQVLTKRALLVSIGPSTSENIRSKGLEVAIEAREHSLPGMIDEIMAHAVKKGDVR
jgi:uroporphyrinogen III methyltransferase/synthase